MDKIKDLLDKVNKLNIRAYLPKRSIHGKKQYLEIIDVHYPHAL